MTQQRRVTTWDPLSPLDSAFLRLEDSSTSLHIASVAVFEGPTASAEDAAPVHHCLVDGIAGTDLLGLVLDPSPGHRPTRP